MGNFKSPQDAAKATILAAKKIAVNEPEETWLTEITVIVKTFERPCCVALIIQSIRKYYPTIKVLVCDDSRKPLYLNNEEPIPGVTWLTLPFEDGHTLGAGRNCLVEKAETEYVFLCDDDHQIVAQTRIKAMWEFLDASGYDIVGGTQGSDEYGAAIFERYGTEIHQIFHRHRGEVAKGVVTCDRVSNTFLGRTQSLRKVGWQAQVYAHEHADFFIRATNAKLKIAQMGRTWVGHDRSCEPVRGWFGKIFGSLMSHRDGVYRSMRLGGTHAESELSAKKQARELYKKHVLDVHGVTDIKAISHRQDRADLEALLGKPNDPV